ncbi:MAG: hypothetical protein ACK5MQ_13360 [Pikeienuella sp.]
MIIVAMSITVWREGAARGVIRKALTAGAPPMRASGSEFCLSATSRKDSGFFSVTMVNCRYLFIQNYCEICLNVQIWRFVLP